MKLEDFLKFIDKTIGELILYGQLHSGKDYSNYELEFKWETNDSKTVNGRENIIYEIADRVFISPNKIYPCVDLVIEQPTQEKKLNIRGLRAGYEPKAFGTGWSNRPGPFIYGIGKGIITGQVKTDTPEFKKKLVDLGLLQSGVEKRHPTKAICNGWVKCKYKVLSSLLRLPSEARGPALTGRFGHGGQ